MSHFSGEIKAQSIVDLIQIYIMQPQPVKLTLTEYGKKVHLWIDKGTVVHAEYDDTFGIDAFYQSMLFKEGSFTTELNSPAPTQTIFKPFTELVLESYVLIDEGKLNKKDLDFSDVNTSYSQIVDQPIVTVRKSDSFKTWKLKLQEFSELDGFICVLLVDLKSGMILSENLKDKDFKSKIDNISAFITQDCKDKKDLSKSVGSELIEVINNFNDYYLLYRWTKDEKYALTLIVDKSQSNLAMSRMFLEEAI